MKIIQEDGYRNYISKYDLANIFNIYDDKDLGPDYKRYNLNSTIVITGINSIPASELSTYKVKDGDTLNSISFKLYGTIELWWLLAKINNISNATITLQSGWTLYTLSKSTVNQILNAMRA